MMEVFIHKELEPLFSTDTNLLAQAMSLQGKIFRERTGRRTQAIIVNGRNYFIKQLSGLSWKKIFKTLFSLRFPELSVKKEWFALRFLRKIGLDVPHVFAYGYRAAFNPTKVQSFIITESLLHHTVSLTDFCHAWQKKPPSFKLKKTIIEKIAEIARKMHLHGIIHQDFYFHHLLLDVSSDVELAGENIKIYLIDFHRARMKKKPRTRWFVKDLAGLYCSGKNIGVGKRDLFRFIKAYRGSELRGILQKEKNFLKKIIKRGEATYQMELKKRTKKTYFQIA